jgi:uncharacterized protein
LISNPFRYGEPVSGEFFTGRYRERELMMSELSQGHNVWLTGPRRSGRSSLVQKVAAELERQGIMTVYINFERAYSIRKFIEIFLSELLRTAFRQTRELEQFIGTLSPELKKLLSLKTSETGELTVDLSHMKDVEHTALLLLNLAQATAEYRRKVFVVCMDEITKGCIPEKLKAALLEAARDQSHVGYLVVDLDPPASNWGETFHWVVLDKIEERYLRAFIKTRFENTGFRIEEALIDEILKQSAGQAYSCQLICRELWNLGHTSKLISARNLPHALDAVLETHAGSYITWWREFSPHQKNLLLAIAHSGGRKIFSKEFVSRYRLGGFSTVQKSVNRLLELKVLDRHRDVYHIADAFFKEWLIRRML